MSEKKGKATPRARVDQYLRDLTLKNNDLYCPWCCVYIDPTRKTTIEYHINSKSHKKNKAGGESMSIASFVDTKSDPFRDLMLTMLCSGIPFYKLNLMVE